MNFYSNSNSQNPFFSYIIVVVVVVIIVVVVHGLELIFRVIGDQVLASESIEKEAVTSFDDCHV